MHKHKDWCVCVCDGQLALAKEGCRKWAKYFPGLEREQMAEWRNLRQWRNSNWFHFLQNMNHSFRQPKLISACYSAFPIITLLLMTKFATDTMIADENA